MQRIQQTGSPLMLTVLSRLPILQPLELNLDESLQVPKISHEQDVTGRGSRGLSSAACLALYCGFGSQLFEESIFGQALGFPPRLKLSRGLFSAGHGLGLNYTEQSG